MESRTRPVWSFNLLLAITAFFLGHSFNAQAASIKVKVLDASKNRPITNAAVCLGTSANTDQFGAQHTDDQGLANFTVQSDTPLVLTVSGSQRKGIQRVIKAGNTNFVRVIHLPLGGLGPTCDAPARIIDSKPESIDKPDLQVAGVNIDRGHKLTTSRSVVLSSIIYGAPTHYRISEDPDFKDAEWLEYQKTPLFTLSPGDGKKKVYFQIRRSVEIENGAVESLSNVSTDWITLKTN